MWVINLCLATGRKMIRKWLLYMIVAVLIQVAISICSWNSDSITLATKRRMQIIGVIQTIMFIFSCITWRRMRLLIDSEFPSSDSQTINDSLKTATILFLIFSHSSHLMYYYLLGADPHWFALTCFGCFGMYVNFVSLLLAGELGINILEWLELYWNYAGRSFIHFLIDRKFLTDRNFQTAICFAAGVILTAAGMYFTHMPPEIKTVTIYIRDLPAPLDGLRIGLISDLHVGPTVGKTRIEHMANLVNNEVRPDIITIVGDLVDGSVAELKNAVEPIFTLRAAQGVYFVTGNHEYYHGDIEEWFKYLRSRGIKILHNSNAKISTRRLDFSSDYLCLAGVDDFSASRLKVPGHGLNLTAALEGCDPDKPRVLLCHQPFGAQVALQLGQRLDLILSGHTHGGQFLILAPFAWLINPFFKGHYELPNGSQVYVSTGVYFWGPPMKHTGLEITKIILRPKLK